VFLESVVGERDGRRRERVRARDVGTDGEVLVVDLRDDLRLGHREEFVASFEVVGVIAEALAAVSGLVEAVGLDQRAHGAIEHHDAFVKYGF